MKKILFPYAALVLAGALIGAFARGALNDDAAPAPRAAQQTLPDVSALDASTEQERAIIGMIESLSLALTQESEYRLVLEEEIESLNARVDSLQNSVGDRPRGAANATPAAKERLQARGRRGGALTVEKLVDAGLDDRTARAIKGKVDDLAMQRLYLRDQAMREGWLGDQRYREESQRLFAEQNGLRSDFGDTAYEAYLYASGRPNRVQVQSVLDNSPAFEAGLRSGDQILSYNGERTFMTNELRTATQQGTAGEMVAIQVVRNGQTMGIYVPRGPLGIQMVGSSEEPAGR